MSPVSYTEPAGRRMPLDAYGFIVPAAATRCPVWGWWGWLMKLPTPKGSA